MACLASSVLTVIRSFRYVRLRFDVRSLAVYLAVSGVMYLTVIQIETGSPWINLVAKVVVGALIVASAVLWKEPDARRLVRQIVAKASSGT